MSTALEPLRTGQRMNQAEFHERYSAMPPGITFELIAGKVFMASPVSDRHSDKSFLASGWLFSYVMGMNTPGVRAGQNGSIILGDTGEVQPDLMMMIAPEFGGQTSRKGRYIAGCPELIIEISRSTLRTDLGAKLAEYEQAGALEYVVFALEPDEIHWHIRLDGRLVRVDPGADGLYRSTAFPGLWLDPVAWLADDGPSLVACLQRGLASPEHVAFVARLSIEPQGGNP